MIPKVQLKKFSIKDNCFTRTEDDLECTYLVTSLIQKAEDDKLEAFEIPLASIDISIMPIVGLDTIKGLAGHYNRIKKADLDYPIILDEFGFIADGWHRVTKAIALGRRTIKAVRLNKMPEPDKTREAE